MSYGIEYKFDEAIRILQEIESDVEDSSRLGMRDVYRSLNHIKNMIMDGDEPKQEDRNPNETSRINMNITPGEWQIATATYSRKENIFSLMDQALWPDQESGPFSVDIVSVTDANGLTVIAFMQNGGNQNNGEFICNSANQLQSYLKSKLAKGK